MAVRGKEEGAPGRSWETEHRGEKGGARKSGKIYLQSRGLERAGKENGATLQGYVIK